MALATVNVYIELYGNVLAHFLLLARFGLQRQAFCSPSPFFGDPTSFDEFLYLFPCDLPSLRQILQESGGRWV